MELDVTRSTAICCGTPNEKKAVLPVECSLILPDYYPDVMKILRYTAKAVTSPVFSDGTGETVSGNVSIEVNYVSEEGEFCFCGQVQPFSHNFVREGNISAAEAEAVADEFSCRAVNKRRIDLHGSLNLTLRTVGTEEREFVKAAEGAGAVCKTDSTDMVTIAGEYFKSFTVEEKGELGYGKPPFGRAVRTAVSAAVNECHVIQDKIVTKGEVRVKVFWSPEEADGEAEKEYFTSSFSFPVSRMIDAPGVLMTDTCDASYRADFPELTPSEDGASLLVKVKVGAFARVYRTDSTEFLTDMFSTEFENSVENGKLTVIDRVFPVELTEEVSEKMELPTSVEKIIDLWTEVQSQPRPDSEGKILYSLRLCMFARDSEDSVAYYEKTVERELSSPAAGRKTAFYNLSATVANEDYTLTRGGSVEISASVVIDGTVYTSVTKNALTACTVDENKKIDRGDAAVVLYYAEPGEEIWNIAKSHRTPLDGIFSENGLSEEVLSARKMLVIPK